MDEELQRRLMAALERPHRLGMIGGDLTDHVAHATGFSAVLAELDLDEGLEHTQAVTTPIQAGDLGTGGGIPGVVLAALWPTWDWTLIDVRSARVQEVVATVQRLGLGASCEVVAAAAQELGQDTSWRESFDVLVARAFGPPALLAECAAGLLRTGGSLIVSEPPEQAGPEAETRWPVAELAALGFAPAQPAQSQGSQFMVLHKAKGTIDRFPRLPPRGDRGWPKVT